MNPSAINSAIASINNPDFETVQSKDLYNGNISKMIVGPPSSSS
ncbi:MAG: hypothetical protein ABF238_02430 [Flavobacteriales bacterium]